MTEPGKEYHIGANIRRELIRQERSVAWFARKIHCSRTNAYKIFEKDNLDIKLLQRISTVLNYDFFRELSEERCRQNDDTSETL